MITIFMKAPRSKPESQLRVISAFTVRAAIAAIEGRGREVQNGTILSKIARHGARRRSPGNRCDNGDQSGSKRGSHLRLLIFGFATTDSRMAPRALSASTTVPRCVTTILP